MRGSSTPRVGVEMWTLLARTERRVNGGTSAVDLGLAIPAAASNPYPTRSGASLSPEETYRAHLSLCALQRTAKLQSVRFFGKILGTAADYYVAEARRAEPPEPPEASEPSATPAEEYGSGCNALSYFVTPELGGTWEELPSVTPEAIVAASRTRKFFTGSLDADVCCFPPFPGTERHYLRAQLARIAHGTTLCPSHKYALSPEGAVEPADPEAEGALPPPTSSQLCEPASWRAPRHHRHRRLADSTSDAGDTLPTGATRTWAFSPSVAAPTFRVPRRRRPTRRHRS